MIINTEENIEQVLALILGNAALIIPLFLWNRSESIKIENNTKEFIEINDKLIKEINEISHVK